MSVGTNSRAVFLQGSTMRHVLVMTGASATGLVAMFAVDMVDMFGPGFDTIRDEAPKLIRAEVRAAADLRREELATLGADKSLVDAGSLNTVA